eukprot:3868383-Prymnesium_polylepis.1
MIDGSSSSAAVCSSKFAAKNSISGRISRCEPIARPSISVSFAGTSWPMRFRNASNEWRATATGA